MKKAKILSGQTIMDLAVQEKGGIDDIFSLIEDSGLNGIHETVAGDELIVNGDPVNRRNLVYIQRKNIQPATAGIKEVESRIFGEEFPAEMG